jgi:hypothetical protein
VRKTRRAVTGSLVGRGPPRLRTWEPLPPAAATRTRGRDECGPAAGNQDEHAGARPGFSAPPTGGRGCPRRLCALLPPNTPDRRTRAGRPVVARPGPCARKGGGARRAHGRGSRLQRVEASQGDPLLQPPRKHTHARAHTRATAHARTHARIHTLMHAHATSPHTRAVEIAPPPHPLPPTGHQRVSFSTRARRQTPAHTHRRTRGQLLLARGQRSASPRAHRHRRAHRPILRADPDAV